MVAGGADARPHAPRRGRRSSPCRCRACRSASAERVARSMDRGLSWTRYRVLPCAKAGAERIGPLVGGLQDHSAALSPDVDLALPVREAELLGKSDGLAAAVPEELAARGLHQ